MNSSFYRLDVSGFEEFQAAMAAYEGDAESIINDVLHGEAGQLIEEEIKRLMPVSGRSWAGKKRAAKNAKSLTEKKENLAITIKTTNAYHYLYFPDDGSSTRRHAGNQQFFKRGGENKKQEIINRCLERLTENL